MLDEMYNDDEPSLSRATTKPHVHDPAAACAELRAWSESNKSASLTADEQAEIDALHRAIVDAGSPR